MSDETKRINEAIQHEINDSGSISLIAFMANQEKRGKVNDLDYAEVRGYRSGLKVALEIIDRMLAEMEDDDENCTEPTADVQEVKHGKWIIEKRNNIGYTHEASIDEFGNPFVKKIHYTDFVYRCN